MAVSSPSQTVFSIGYDFHVGNGVSGTDNGDVWNIYNYRTGGPLFDFVSVLTIISGAPPFAQKLRAFCSFEERVGFTMTPCRKDCDITCSCYCRQPFPASAKRRELFLQILEEVRVQYEFTVAGYVVMPEHFHIEKLRYMHRNPVKRGLVKSPELWRWSSFRQYRYMEPGRVTII